MRMKGKIVLIEEGKIQLNSEQSVIKGEKTSGIDGESWEIAGKVVVHR